MFSFSVTKLHLVVSRGRCKKCITSSEEKTLCCQMNLCVSVLVSHKRDYEDWVKARSDDMIVEATFVDWIRILLLKKLRFYLHALMTTKHVLNNLGTKHKKTAAFFPERVRLKIFNANWQHRTQILENTVSPIFWKIDTTTKKIFSRYKKRAFSSTKWRQEVNVPQKRASSGIKIRGSNGKNIVQKGPSPKISFKCYSKQLQQF